MPINKYVIFQVYMNFSDYKNNIFDIDKKYMKSHAHTYAYIYR